MVASGRVLSLAWGTKGMTELRIVTQTDPIYHLYSEILVQIADIKDERAANWEDILQCLSVIIGILLGGIPDKVQRLAAVDKLNLVISRNAERAAIDALMGQTHGTA